MSFSYPSLMICSIVVPIQDSLKCVKGEFVASNLTVPSLKTDNPNFCLISPFSRGSGIFSWLINLSTPLNGCCTRIPSFSCAAIRFCLNGNCL